MGKPTRSTKKRAFRLQISTFVRFKIEVFTQFPSFFARSFPWNETYGGPEGSHMQIKNIVHAN